LVLSTLHTNSASGALPRLIDMGAEPFLVASTLNAVVAQRLVRRLCPDCRKEYNLDEKTLKGLEEVYNMKEILDNLKKSGMLKGKIEAKDNWNSIKLYKPSGCDQCSGGYKGRIGIFEALEVDDDMGKMISQKSSTEEIENKAREKGMLTMLEDGFLKTIQGITSVEEVLRVTKE